MNCRYEQEHSEWPPFDYAEDAGHGERVDIETDVHRTAEGMVYSDGNRRSGAAEVQSIAERSGDSEPRSLEANLRYCLVNEDLIPDVVDLCIRYAAESGFSFNPGDMDAYINILNNTTKLVKSNLITYICCMDGLKVVGTVQVTFGSPDPWDNSRSMTCSMLYVLPEYRSGRIAWRMIQYVKKIAEQGGFDKVVFCVEYRPDGDFGVYTRLGAVPREVIMEYVV